MPIRLPVGTIFLSEKYSVSAMSNVDGCVTTRLVTSSVLSGMYWISMPGVRLELVGDLLALVHRRAEVAQHDLFLRVDVRKAGDGGGPGDGGRALDERTPRHATGGGSDSVRRGLASWLGRSDMVGSSR